MRRAISTLILLAVLGTGLSGCFRARQDIDIAHAHAAAEPLHTMSLDDAGAAEGYETASSLKARRDGGGDLSLGKRHYRERNFGLSERYYRRAVERSPEDVEAWIGLAAAYDQLGRFELADEAYSQAMLIAGPTAEILNNRGYSYMLRGDITAARKSLVKAQSLAPDNRYVQENLRLLEEFEG